MAPPDGRERKIALVGDRPSGSELHLQRSPLELAAIFLNRVTQRVVQGKAGPAVLQDVAHREGGCRVQPGQREAETALSRDPINTRAEPPLTGGLERGRQHRP